METLRALLRRIGPGFITAAVVLGPGSIVASSTAGATAGYGLVWVLLMSALFMMVYTSMGARLGCALPGTPLQYVADRWGRPAAAVVGLSGFLVAAGFQFGNNIGVAVAMDGLLPQLGIGYLWPAVFTAASLAFVWGFRSLYAALEKAMLAFVLAMLAAFLVNLAFTGLSLGRLATEILPSPIAEGQSTIVRATLGTTFSAVAAFYQAYLVRAKGWTKNDLGAAVLDARLGIAMLAGISLVILATASEGLQGKAGEFNSIGQLAAVLSSTLGPAAVLVFSLGLAAASFSSFITNTLIGGTLMADGLGQGDTVSSRASKVWASVALVAGAAVATFILTAGTGAAQSLLVAQSATLFAAPIAAVLLFAFTCSRAIMGDLRNGWATILLGALGLAVVAWLNIALLMRIIGAS